MRVLAALVGTDAGRFGAAAVLAALSFALIGPLAGVAAFLAVPGALYLLGQALGIASADPSVAPVVLVTAVPSAVILLALGTVWGAPVGIALALSLWGLLMVANRPSRG